MAVGHDRPSVVDKEAGSRHPRAVSADFIEIEGYILQITILSKPENRGTCRSASECDNKNLFKINTTPLLVSAKSSACVFSRAQEEKRSKSKANRENRRFIRLNLRRCARCSLPWFDYRRKGTNNSISAFILR